MCSCTEAADGAYRIETTLLPRDAASQREQLARRLAASDRSLDIMSLDPPFIPELAEPGFLAPVPDELQDTEGIVQGAVDSASWNDELVTVPFWANTQLLWYRESVVEEAGLDMSEKAFFCAAVRHRGVSKSLERKPASLALRVALASARVRSTIAGLAASESASAAVERIATATKTPAKIGWS